MTTLLIIIFAALIWGGGLFTGWTIRSTVAENDTSRLGDRYLDGYFDAVQAIRDIEGGGYDSEVEREAVAMRLEDTLVEKGIIPPFCRI